MDSIVSDDFGALLPGQSKTFVVYARNEGSISFKLYMSTSNWILRDSAGNLLSQDYKQYFALTWDYNNSIIVSGETRSLTFTLTISPSIAETDVSTFSFNIVVNAVQ